MNQKKKDSYMGVEVGEQSVPATLDRFAIEIGKRIKTYRKIANMSQKDLGVVLDVTSQQIHKYENGSNEISYKKICIIAKAVDVPAEYLIDGVDIDGEKTNNTALKNEKNIKYLLEISRHLGAMDEGSRQKVVDFAKMMRQG
jgi:transcriptional regulator with XRE-family HTH domain